MRLFTISNDIIVRQTLEGNNVTVKDLDRVRIFSITKDKFRLVDEHNPSLKLIGNKLDIKDLLKDLNIDPCCIAYDEVVDLGFRPSSLIDVWFHNFKRLLGIDDLNKYFTDISYKDLHLTIKVKETHNFLKGEVTFKVCEEEPEQLTFTNLSRQQIREERKACQI